MTTRALMICVLLASTAHADGGTRHGIGIGVEQTLGGLTGAALVYDSGAVRFDLDFTFAIIGVDRIDATTGGGSARVFFVVHKAQAADFSLGVGGAVLRAEVRGADDAIARSTTLHLEVSAQLRAFIVSNVAMSASAGMVLVSKGDPAGGPSENGVTLGGQLIGGAGLVYFFQ